MHDNNNVKENDLIIYKKIKWSNTNIFFNNIQNKTKDDYNIGIVLSINQVTDYCKVIKIINQDSNIVSINSLNEYKIISSPPGEK